MSQHRPRRHFRGEELFIWYAVTGLIAAVVGTVVGLVGLGVLSALKVGCRPAGGDVLPENELHCPDGTGRVLPALVLVGIGGLAVLVTAAALLSRRADADTLRRVSRHILWLATVFVALPAIASIRLLLSPAALPENRPLIAVAVAAAVFAAAPLATSYVRPARTNLVLIGCLVVPVAVLLLAQWLTLLVPVALALAGLWSIALWLHRTGGIRLDFEESR